MAFNNWHRIENIFLATQYSEQEIIAAKTDDIKKWKENHAYKTIYYEGQKTIITTWVLTESRLIEKTRLARLVAWGFEEDSSEILKDSPTCTKGSFRLILKIMVSNRWACNSINIKPSFIPGKEIDRLVHLTPPPIWRKRYSLEIKHLHIWFIRSFKELAFTAKEELDKLGVKYSHFESALFF